MNWNIGFYLCLALGLFGSVVTSDNAISRNVSAPDINPNCSSICEEPWIVYLTASSKSNILHHLWGTHGGLTSMIAVTNSTVELQIDWEKFKDHQSGSVEFDDNNQVHYVFGFVIPNLILFNDVKDTGQIDSIPEEDRINVPVSDFTWNVTRISKDNDHETGITFETVEYKGETLSNESRIVIQVAAYGIKGRSTVLPHLARTPNSGQFDIVLDHLDVDPEKVGNISSPRWGMNMILYSSPEENDKPIYDFVSHKSLDDEHTPGIFDLDEITLQSQNTGKRGYLQWRPVSYTSEDRDVSASTNVHINETLAALTTLSNDTKMSLAYAVFGEALVKELVSTETIILFGEKMDKFYTNTEYTTWTLGFGYGSPPVEPFSTLIIIIISLGIGIPALMFLVGGMIIGVRKCRGN